MRRTRGAGIVVVLAAAVGAARAEQTVGLFLHDEAAYDGYTLFAPLGHTTTYLIDNDGQLVHSWPSGLDPLGSVYLLEDGSILRVCAGGWVQRIAWDGALLWQYQINSGGLLLHHDVEPLPGGHLLAIVRESMTPQQAIAAGLDPANLDGSSFQPDRIVEIEPVGATGANIVWEWRARDHLIQDFDPTKANYGVVADNPQLVDINVPGFLGADWLHVNAVDYHPELDQIVLTASGVNEIWIIDHSTSTAEAAGHTGGNSGMGGDLLYRWGSPENYDRGGPSDLQLLFPHDSRWIEPGLPGAGNITIFNNYFERVDEIVPPLLEDGGYELPEDEAYGPGSPVWSHTHGLSAPNMSGAHRLPNGNTLLCVASGGIFLEVTHEHELVWHYVSPVQGDNPMTPCDTDEPSPVFRNHRYPPDHPAFLGQDLTPLGPIEVHEPPPPVPDGSGATSPLAVLQPGPGGTSLRVTWDSVSCGTASEYQLIHGHLSDVASYTLQGAACDIGELGTFVWQDVPPGNLFFLIVSVDPAGCFEGSWGLDSSGDERNGAGASGMCGVTLKDASARCP
jgi:hypothetical protein